MPQGARITSVDAIGSFRSSLIVYLSQARPELEEISADALRTRMWLENDQRTHWENQVRRRHRQVEEAQAALFSARLSNLSQPTAAQYMAVHRAKLGLHEAEAKLRRVKQWNREFDSKVEPLVKQMEKLHTVLTNDMAQAVVYLAQVVEILNAYADKTRPAGEGAAQSKEASAPFPNRRGETMNASGTKLTGITRALWNQWRQTKDHWQDARSEEFEHKYMDELQSSVDKAVAVIEQLNKLITKIKKDCE